ncbi:MAG: hypothetical protein Kow00121_47940 [Elainellaceae cyanobacterium]
MFIRAQQEEFIASIAQSFDVGDYDYLPPDQLQALNKLIANAWDALKLDKDVDARIRDIQQMLGH